MDRVDLPENAGNMTIEEITAWAAEHTPVMQINAWLGKDGRVMATTLGAGTKGNPVETLHLVGAMLESALSAYNTLQAQVDAMTSKSSKLVH